MRGFEGTGQRAAAIALAWLAGVAAQLQMAALWQPLPVAALALAAVLVGAIAWRSRGGWPRTLLLIAAVAALAFAVAHQRASIRLADALDPALEGPDLVVTGVVSSLPRPGPTGTRFFLDVESASQRGQPVRVPSRLSLGWYRSIDDDALLAGPSEPVHAGQRWLLTVRLRAPHGSANPHGFDLELWAFEQDIGAFGSVRARPDTVTRKLDDRAGAFIERQRERVRDAIERRITDPAISGVLAALAIGDQAAIERNDWDLFRITGVAHLMSISGLHVTMFAWLAGLVVAWLW